MGKKHTIDTLTKDVESYKRSTNGRLSTITKTLSDIQPKVQEMHDFIIDYRGFQRGRNNRNKDGSININKDVWGLIIKLVLIISALVGITQLTK